MNYLSYDFIQQLIDNIQITWPMVWLLLPLPWIARRYLKPQPSLETSSLRMPLTSQTLSLSTGKPQYANPWLSWLVLICVWILLLFSLSRPQLLGDPRPLERSGRDLMVSIDISASMLEEDFLYDDKPITRLQAVQAIATDFIEQRGSDRVGLILFGQVAYLQAPLTFDHRSVSLMLNEAFARMAGNATAIGDSIGMAVKALKDQPKNARVLILLTDGENTAGALGVQQALELAQKIDLKIYTIGVGSTNNEMSQQMKQLNDLFGNFGQQLPNLSNRAEIDEQTLQNIADSSGGAYYRATNLEELSEIYEQIDLLEPRADDAQMFRPTKDVFFWPLSIAFLLFMSYLCSVFAIDFIKSIQTQLSNRRFADQQNDQSQGGQ